MKKVKIIGVPMDLGQDRRGVDMGPSVFRVAGLDRALRELGYEVSDAGNVDVSPAESISKDNEKHRYLPEIAKVSQQLADRVEAALQENAIPVILGGDHSIAIGSVAGVSSFYRKQGQSIGIIWLDAHADFNTPETTPSGNIHGMPLAAILGYGAPELTHISGFAPKVHPENVVLLGIRSVDPEERELLRQAGFRTITMSELDERGMGSVINEAIEIASRGTAGFHITMDMDFIDPLYAPGVGTPVPGGATYRESHLAMEKMAQSGHALSVEITETNPLLDTRNLTAQLGVELILSALGKRTL